MSMIERCLELYESMEYFVHYPGRPLGVEYWNAKTDPDGKSRDLTSERQQRKQDLFYIADFVNRLESGRVLDIGCGLGELLEQIDEKHLCTGLDPSPKAIEVASRFSKADLILGTLNDIVIENTLFDCVISHHVIEHVENPIDFVRNVVTILRPGGFFICGTPNFASPSARVFGDRFRLLHDPTHISLFTDDSLLRLLRDEGLIIQKVEYPFFKTRFATLDACKAMLSGDGSVSPPFWGSFVTVFARKPGKMDLQTGSMRTTAIGD